MATDNLLFIYAMTTIGVSFRTLFVESVSKSLQPFHGTAEVADRRQCINADTDGTYELTKTIHLVKTQVPLREAPIVPSQPEEDFPVSSYVGKNPYVGESSHTGESSEHQGPYNDIA